eukprot:6200354-Pleurochrysis_carterae.AAC.1
MGLWFISLIDDHIAIVVSMVQHGGRLQQLASRLVHAVTPRKKARHSKEVRDAPRSATVSEMPPTGRERCGAVRHHYYAVLL